MSYQPLARVTYLEKCPEQVVIPLPAGAMYAQIGPLPCKGGYENHPQPHHAIIPDAVKPEGMHEYVEWWTP